MRKRERKPGKDSKNEEKKETTSKREQTRGKGRQNME